MMPLLLLAALFAQSAKPAWSFDPTTALRGRWTADKLSMIETMPEYQRIQQEAARKAFKDAFLASMPDIAVDFADTTFTLTLGKEQTLVNYTIVKVEGPRLLIRTTESRTNGRTDEDEVEAEFVNRDTMTLIKKGDPFTFRLKRVTAAAPPV